jgi:hypothetical protein
LNSRPAAIFAGWLFLFGSGGIIYILAQANLSLSWNIVFVGSVFLAVALGIVWEFFIAHRNPLNARNIILIGVLYWLLLDPLVMREGLDEVPHDVMLRALAYAAMFVVSVWMGYFLPPLFGIRRVFSSVPARTNDTLLFWFAVIVYALSILPLLTVSGGSLTELWHLLLAGYSPDANVGWRRGMLGDQRDFLKSLARLLQLTIPFFVTYLLRRPLSGKKKIALALIMLSVYAVIFFSGERRVLALTTLGPLMYVYISTTRATRKRWIPAFLIFTLFLFWMMQAQVQFRSGGFYDFDAKAIEANPLEMHRDNNFYWFAIAVDTMPSSYEFTNQWVFSQVLTHPIPRFLWPGKPYSMGFPFVQWEEVGASLSISVVGELYVGQGLLGILVGGLVYGWVARNWDELQQHLTVSNAAALIYAIGLTLLLIGVRSFSDLVINWYVMIILMFSFRFFGIREFKALRFTMPAGLEGRA